jgi:molybdopterin-biosynthesis enzyme MoeA-like protein
MGFGVIVIGDEIMRGKRQDKHFAKLVALLGARGLRLDWCEYLGDDRERLTGTLARTFAADDVAFSFGGIGATPDDHTRQCAAAALGVPLELHRDAEAEIRARFGAETNAQRLKMGEFPRGASIIPNAYNRIPGFSVARHYFVPGFPVMAWPMIEWVLDTHYAHLFHQSPEADASILVYGAAESTLTPLMEAIESRFARIKAFSLPSIGEDGQRRHIELGVRGDPESVPPAMAAIESALDEMQTEWARPTSGER